MGEKEREDTRNGLKTQKKKINDLRFAQFSFKLVGGWLAEKPPSFAAFLFMVFAIWIMSFSCVLVPIPISPALPI